MARHLQCVVQYLRSLSVSNYDYYAMGLVGLLCGACNETCQTWTLKASVSRVMCLIEIGITRSSVDMSTYCSKFMDFNFSSLRSSKVVC